jgi:hypothetical protein
LVVAIVPRFLKRKKKKETVCLRDGLIDDS